MSVATPAPGPTRGRDRIHSLDVIRGVALFGILLMNITMFGLPMAYSDPTVYGGATGANLWAWIAATVGFEGTQRALFSILFGAGLVLLTSRLEAAGRPDAADIYYRRALWLIVAGVIHAYLLLWIGEILYFYGLTALFLYAFRKLSPRALLTIAAAGLVVNGAWNVLDSYAATQKSQKAEAAQAVVAGGRELTDEQQSDIDAWSDFVEERKPSDAVLEADIEAHRGSYPDVLVFQAPLGAHHESWFAYRYFFDVFSLMLVGMALFKLGVLTLKQPSRVYWTMVLVGYPLGLAINLYELNIVLDGEFSVLAFLRASWTYDVGRLAMTAGHLGVLLLFCRSGWLQWLQRGLAAVGRMALTSYVSQSIICAFVFYGFGLGLYGELERYELYYVVAAIWLFQLVVSPIWLTYYRFGPLEWLWRTLTYLERQPLRRRDKTTTGPEPEPQSA
jgi:uncharacterized protein